VHGLSKKFLQSRYDNPKPTPPFHLEMWRECCTDAPHVAFAAPRGFAKSTCITHAFVLAAVLFREKRYVLIVSNTEGLAAEFLGDIKLELQENVELIQAFGIRRFTKDSATDIVVEFTDGTRFRMRAIGVEQKVRGRKWGGSRPDLVVMDDGEDDEQVESDLRREKFKNWFYKALMPSLSDTGHVRVVGTILHMDSLLYNLIHKNTEWVSRLYKAHKSFDDFSELLWADRWPEARLRKLRDMAIAAGSPESYSQERLNNPIDQAEAYFRHSDFVAMEPSHYELNKNFYAGVDFAISDSARADYTVITVAGMDQFGVLHVVYVERFRGDQDEILRYMFALQTRFAMQMWKVEKGVIWESLQGELERRMLETGVFLSCSPGQPVKDKRARARPLQARLRAGGMRFDKNAKWYPALEEEMLHFPKGAKKDQVDSLAWLCIGLSELSAAATPAEEYAEQYERDVEKSEFGFGVCDVTGY